MPDLESTIDGLYRQRLGEFTAARNALAKTLTGADAKHVRQLAKPTVVPWAVNQVYWRARPVYDSLITSGERLRKAQVAALEGRAADVRAASDAHRQAIAEAVKQAERLAAASGSTPGADALMRTFEALSLAPALPEPPGRLTRELRPAGFEALAGVTPAASLRSVRPTIRGVRLQPDLQPPARQLAAARKKEEAARKKQDAAQKRHDAEVRKAEATLERARRRMEEAEQALRAIRSRAP